MRQIDGDFLLKCHGWSKSEYYVDRMTEALLEGKASIMIPDEDYEEACAVRETVIREEQRLYDTARLNNEGIALEKEGCIEEAINVYEQNIEIGYPATHSYERLMILYRKRKDYENEIRVARLAVDVFQKCNEEKAGRLIERYPEREQDIRKALDMNEPIKNESGWYIFSPYDTAKYIRRMEKSKELLKGVKK